MSSPVLVIPETPTDIDPDWMSHALRASGVLDSGRVIHLQLSPVGNGLICDSFQFTVTYDGVDTLTPPRTVVGKFPRRNPDGRLHVSGGYLREVCFYRDLAPRAGDAVPKAYFADINVKTGLFALILEDLGPARAVDQLTGCSISDAETAVVEAAALHARFWNHSALRQLDWLKADHSQLDHAAKAVAMFKERYGSHVEANHLTMLDRFPAAARAMVTAVSPYTVQHGDFRLDNVLYDIQAGARRFGILDWQTANCGPALVDVSYFLGTGLAPAVRRAEEHALVARYHNALMAGGVANYSFDACWRDYRLFALRVMQVGIMAPMHAKRTERGDALFVKMVRSACEMMLDLGTLELCGA